MIQCGSGACFDAEAFDRLSIAGEILGNELQRDRTAEARVVGTIHDAHAAGAELMSYPIMRDCFADHTERVSI